MLCMVRRMEAIAVAEVPQQEDIFAVVARGIICRDAFRTVPDHGGVIRSG